MRLGLVDCSAITEGEPMAAPRFPSPALLRGARTSEATSVVYLEPSSIDSTNAVDRMLAVVPAWCARIAAPILERCSVPVEVIDPWATTTDENQLGYDLVLRGCHGDVDLAPHRWPVHPWAADSRGRATDPDDRLRAEVAGLAGLHTTRVVIGDAQTHLTAERVRLIAELVTGSLKTRKSLIELALRVWPEDLVGERMIDHLSLLPVVGLDLLVGSLHAPSVTAMNGALSPDEVVTLIGSIARAGLGPVTTLSIVAGLPGESIRDSISALDRTLRIAAEHRLAAVRCSLWIGTGAPPADPDEQRTRFLASHPSWTEEEYRGFHDLVAVIRKVAPNIELVGPGFLPSWDSVP